MKKLVLSFLACLAIVQQSEAATPALTESLLEYQAIINAIGDPTFDVIDVTEFITDIKRKTDEIDVLGKVKYEILTEEISEKSPSHHHHEENIYTATLIVSPNPGIGPNIVTVEEIKHKH